MLLISRAAAILLMTLMPISGLAASNGLTLTNKSQTVQFDLAALEAMPAVEFTTTTTWTDGPQTFTGVSLADFMKSNSLGEGTIRAYAINNYSVDIPSSDAIEGGPIIAYRRNGELMSVRDKGPLWIVYPYDSDPEYQSEVIYSRSIWQLDRLEFVE